MNTLKTLLYMGTLHGFFTYYFPFQLSSRDKPFFYLGNFHFLAIPFWVFGVVIIVQCSIDIIRRGRGTPAHLDPPQSLMINGWYRRVRNPIYLGAVIAQVGYILWFGSGLAILYVVLFFLAFHFLIVVIEEPILRNTFGAAYDEYCQKVPRWIP